jgi:hypothetical protein
MIHDARVKKYVALQGPVPAAPLIAEGAGSELNDRYAGKLVDAWIAHIGKKTLNADCQTAINLRLNRSSLQCGTPQSQTRLAKLIRDSYADSLIGMQVDTGTRGRFCISFATLDTYDEDSALLTLSVTILSGRGQIHPQGIVTYSLARLTRHALMRLVQRGGCERPEELTEVIRHAYYSLFMIGLRLPADDLDGAWLIPFRMPDGAIAAFAATKQYTEKGKRRAILKTFLHEDQLALEQMDACAALFDWVTSNKVEECESYEKWLVKFQRYLRDCRMRAENSNG